MSKVDSRIEALEAKLKQLKVQQQRSEQRAQTIAARRSRHDGREIVTRGGQTPARCSPLASRNRRVHKRVH